MRVFVTGAAGFIGFHLVARLIADGHTVSGLDSLTDYYDPTLKRARLALLDAGKAFRSHVAALEDTTSLDRIVSEFAPDVIVHLAAQPAVRHSLERPRAYLDANVLGTFNVMEIARATQPKHLVLASSSAVYGAGSRTPFRETDRTDHPLSFYAATKKASEDMAHSYAHLWKIPTTALRFFSVFGPWGRPDMALFRFVDWALAGKPVEIYGYGRMARDFTYVDDVVEAITRVIGRPPRQGEPVCDQDSLSPVAPYRVVNVGQGRPTALMDFVDVVEETLGVRLERRFLAMHPGDAESTCASSELLTALTSFSPSTDVRTGVARFVGWYREFYRERVPARERVGGAGRR